MQPKPKLLICELWGLGDLVLATTLISAAAESFEVHLLAKPHARELLQPTFPHVIFHDFVAPWTVHRGKYHLWRWPWRVLLSLLWRLRGEHYSAAASVRHDPRDHLLMWLAGVQRRLGFPTKGSGKFLTDSLPPERDRHRVESWRAIASALQIPGSADAAPLLDPQRYATERMDQLLAPPLVCLHAGAAAAVRRWPEAYFEATVRNLRERFDFRLLLIPDHDGFGRSLAPLADVVLEAPALRELVDVLARADLLLCNDSGPMHIAAACGTPTIPFWGPGHFSVFRPWGDSHQPAVRDICSYRPCFDYCRFQEPYCLTSLTPEEVWPEVSGQAERILARQRAAP